MSSSQENPWATGGTYISVGGLQRVLRLAESASYKGLLVDDEYQRERGEHNVENCASLIQIKSLKEISNLDETLNKVVYLLLMSLCCFWQNYIFNSLIIFVFGVIIFHENESYYFEYIVGIMGIGP